MIKRCLAAALVLSIAAPSAEALDLLKAKHVCKQAITLPLYLTAGFIAGPVISVIVWKKVGATQLAAAQTLQKIKADAVKPKEAHEALKDAAK